MIVLVLHFSVAIWSVLDKVTLITKIFFSVGSIPFPFIVFDFSLISSEFILLCLCNLQVWDFTVFHFIIHPFPAYHYFLVIFLNAHSARTMHLSVFPTSLVLSIGKKQVASFTIPLIIVPLPNVKVVFVLVVELLAKTLPSAIPPMSLVHVVSLFGWKKGENFSETWKKTLLKISNVSWHLPVIFTIAIKDIYPLS